MTTQTTPISPEAMTTLRYWAPGDFSASFGDDAADHEAPAYAGLAECIDRRLLRHVPDFSQWADGYAPTTAGADLLKAGK